MPDEWAALTVERQLADPSSTLAFYRRAVQLRSARGEFDGSGIEWVDDQVFRRPGGLTCAFNTGTTPLPLPDGEILLTSGELVDGMLPPDTAAWLV